MTNAQSIRKLKQEKINTDIKNMAEVIFEWALKEMEEKIKDNFYGKFLIYKLEKSYEISFLNGNTYDKELMFFFEHHDEVKLFQKLKRFFDIEEGYNTILNTKASIYNTPAISLTITIEEQK